MYTTNKRFAIGLSYARIHTDKVGAIADILARTFTRNRILFQGYHEAEFARPDLDIYLQKLYFQQTELNVVFLCDAFNTSDWCGVEWKAIRARSNSSESDTVMFLKLDDGTPQGFFSATDYAIDISSRTPEEVAGLIYDRYLLLQGINADIKETDIDRFAELKEYLSQQLSQKRKYHPSFRGLEIDDHLFPEGIVEQYSMAALNDEKGMTKTIREIVEESWQKEKNHLMIEGVAGSGKTVTLLSLPDRFAPHLVPSVYVPLWELKSIKEGETLEEYIRKRYFPSQESMFERFLQLTYAPWKNGPRLLLLLDGFGEIAREKRFSIGEDISRWSERPGVQIVLSSRHDSHLYVLFREGYFRVLLQPLSRKTVADYLQKTEISSPKNESQWNLIRNPSMLALYAQTEQVIARSDKTNEYQYFTAGNSAGSIIWNYLQKEIWRYRNSEEEAVKCVLAVTFIAPYIAWRMLEMGVSLIEENDFCHFIEQGYRSAVSLEAHQFRHPALRNHKITFPEEAVIEFFQEELTLFVKGKREEYYAFIYPLFREALAALHLINVAYLSSELPRVWQMPMDHSVMDFVNELVTQEEADVLWEKNRTSESQNHEATVNMLELQKRKRNYDFSALDFRGLHLQGISLFPYRVPGSIRLQFPRSADLCASLSVSEKSFYPEGHSDSVTVLAMTPDGTRCVSGSDDHTLRVWDLVSQQYLMTLEGHKDAVTALAVIPDDKNRIVSASLDNTLRIWDLTTGECDRVLEVQDFPVSTLALAPDGKRCICGSLDHILRLWDMESGKCLWKHERQDDSISVLAVAPGRRRFVTGSDDGSLRVWDLGSGQLLRVMEGHRGFVSALSITPDGRRCVSGSWDGTIRVWDLDYGQCLMVLKGHKESVNLLAITPDGRRCVSGAWDKTLRVWDLKNGLCLHVLEGHKDVIRALDFLPGGGICLSSSWDNTLRVWDLESGTCLRMAKREGAIGTLAISPDGKRCVCGSDDKALRIWDLESNTWKAFEGPQESVSVLSMTPDGRRCVSWSEDKNLRVWDLESGRCLDVFEAQDSLRALAITPDGKRCVSGDSGKTLRVWNLDDGQCLMSLPGHEWSVDVLAVTPDGRRCVSGSKDKTLRVWNLDDGQCLKTLSGHERSVDVLAVTPDGRRCVSGSKDKTLRVWNLETGDCKVLDRCKGAVKTLAISPDGTQCASWSEDKTLRLWNLESLKCIWTMEGFVEAVSALAFTADGSKIACWTWNTHVSIWLLVSGPENWQYDHSGPIEPVRSIAVSPDGRHCVCGSVNGTIYSWRYDQDYAGNPIPIRILPLSVVGLDFSRAEMPASLRVVLQQNGANV